MRADDRVLVSDEHSNRACWSKALVEETYPDSDEIVRRVLVRTTHGRFLRDVHKLSLLAGSD